MKNEPISFPDVQVRLKPIFGIKPGIYLLVLYSLALLGALYWLFLLPGIQQPGTLYRFTSEPSGAAVFLTDSQGKQSYFGSTPLEAYLPEGTGTLELTRPHFKPQTQKLTTGNRLFFSRFFPAVEDVHIKLTQGDLPGIKSEFDLTLTDWASTTASQSEYAYPSLFSRLRLSENWIGVTHPLPPVFTQLKSDYLAAGGSLEDFKKFVLGRLTWVADPALYKDLCQSLGFYQENWGFKQQWDIWSSLVKDKPGLAPWILVNQPWKIRNTISKDPDYLKAREAYISSLEEKPQVGNTPSGLILSNMEFLGVPGGVFALGDSKGAVSLEPPFGGSRMVEVQPFWLGKTEVTHGQFANFLKANPSWAPGEKEKLISQGLVDDRYLADWSGSTAPASRETYPVTGVSFYSAQAFVQWMGKNNPAYEITLPFEEEWEWAAREAKSSPPVWTGENLDRQLKSADKGQRSGLGHLGLQGQVWEWTASDAAPAAFLVPESRKPQQSLESSDKKSVRSGSFADSQILTWSTRGAQKANWSSPYLGFRVLVRKK
ncbi:MAG: hypothetical protein A2Z96_04830 [Spirochaetes bacterium GWB1_48_6]|nr:MAG: hypothetical protein A2Z96_04830 [Spirochaetes bacterium GWB1_48_6]